jgi:hypothetical protein
VSAVRPIEPPRDLLRELWYQEGETRLRYEMENARARCFQAGVEAARADFAAVALDPAEAEWLLGWVDEERFKDAPLVRKLTLTADDGDGAVPDDAYWGYPKGADA